MKVFLFIMLALVIAIAMLCVEMLSQQRDEALNQQMGMLRYIDRIEQENAELRRECDMAWRAALIRSMRDTQK